MENKKLNILFLCSWYPNPDEKSNGIFIKRHAQALSLKHNVTVLFVKSVSNIREVVSITNEVQNFKEYLYFYPKINSTLPLISSIQKFLKFKKEYRSAINKIPNADFDVIHLNTIFPAAIPALYALKKYPEAKLFITEHWSGYYSEDGNYKGNVMIYYTKKIVAKAKAVFVISEKLRQSMLKHGLKNSYRLINNVVDTDVFKPLYNQSADNSVLKILHVSSLVEREKNISGIISIARKLKENNKKFHLTVMGENNLEIKDHLKLTEQYNLTDEISFTGYKQAEEIAISMNNANVFLLFSYFEGMPVVVLESIACGLPVISTDVGEVKNMIQPGMGIVLNTNSIQECVEALLNYKRENFSGKDQMHQSIKQNYSSEEVCDQVTQLYNLYT